MKRIFVTGFVALVCATAQHSSAQTVADWQKKAVAKYPALAIDGSTLHQAFMALYEDAKAQQPELLSKPDWPMRLAASAAKNPEQIVSERKLLKAAAIVQPEDRKAFDNLYFGDSEELTRYKLAHSTKLKATKAKSDRGDEKVFYSLNVDGHSFAFQTAFDDGKLYQVRFVESFCDEYESRKFALSEYDEWSIVLLQAGSRDLPIKESWSVLSDIAVVRFGKPTVSKGYPVLLPFERDSIINRDKWDIGKRQVGLGIINRRNAIGPMLSISDQATLQKLEGIDAAKRKEEIDKAAGGF